MRRLITEKLKRIEKDSDIKILYACESGSRAWGFPSPDSDYDVRFIYARPKDWYLTLKNKPDTLEFPINDELDISGWDIKKALGLLHKSNAALMEWIQSPIVYMGDEMFLDEIRTEAQKCFSSIGTMYHYLSMSQKYSEDLKGDDVKLKRYFYALRAALAGKWIRLNGTMPPIEFHKMLHLADVSLRPKILEWIETKALNGESYMIARNENIGAFLQNVVEENGSCASDLSAGNGDLEYLDVLFRKYIS